MNNSPDPTAVPAGTPSTESLHRWATGITTIVATTTYLITDLVEIAVGFSTAQLWATFLALALTPMAMIGLHAIQAERGKAMSLLGAALYGYSFVYFAGTAMLALEAPDYATLVEGEGLVFMGHGVVMMIGGVLFGVSSWRAGVFPRWTSALLLLGCLWTVGAVAVGIPTIYFIGGNCLRNLGLLGMGITALKSAGSIES